MTATRADQESFRLLEESRLREKRQTLFYRGLAAEAEWADRLDEAERLNGLHADEQHHLSRLTARVLEMGGKPADLRDVPRPEVSLESWEDVARSREGEEIAWYERALESDAPDGETRKVFDEILQSERHHQERLGGKWMSA